MTWVRQDPDARKDYGFDWSLDEGETITTSTWTSQGLTVDSPAKSDTTTWVWVSGGQAGGRYTVTNRVVTSLGRTDDRTLHFMIENA